MPRQGPAGRGERRKLTAAWLNIAAAAFVSAGTLPLLHALVAEGWVVRVSAPAALAVVSLTTGTIIHLVVRSLTGEESRIGLDSSSRMFLSRSRLTGASMSENTPEHDERFPTEHDVDEVIQEFGGNPRAAIKGLLHDLEVLASDYDTAVSNGFVRGAMQRRRRAQS